jgi:hypothetical protein
MIDRSVRSLEHLERSASTSRVLNLRAIGLHWGRDADYKKRPFFQSSALNAGIIVKHRLRGDEPDLFSTPRRVATKILVPLQSTDLRLGARYAFVGQRGFKEALYNAFGIAIGHDSVDLRTLAVLDESPTLDPFLLRELLLRHGLAPARCYFELSQADANRMLEFAQREIAPLVELTGGSADPNSPHTIKLTRKILSNAGDAELEPLRRTLQLDHHQFEEGVFSWKAFLYYKWKLVDLLPQVQPVLHQIETIRPRGGLTSENKASIAASRETLRGKLADAARQVRATLEFYETAYRAMTQNRDSGAFRDFILGAPRLFNELGDRLGAIDHMVSFWSFRFPKDRLSVVTADELADIFGDFENGFSADRLTPERARLAAPRTIDFVANTALESGREVLAL